MSQTACENGLCQTDGLRDSSCYSSVMTRGQIGTMVRIFQKGLGNDGDTVERHTLSRFLNSESLDLGLLFDLWPGTSSLKNPTACPARWKLGIRKRTAQKQKPHNFLRLRGFLLEWWCPEEDSNLHVLQHWYLKPARLPIPPSGRAGRLAKAARAVNRGDTKFPADRAVCRERSIWRQGRFAAPAPGD